MATTKEIRISQLPLEKDIRGMMTVGVNSANQSVKIPIGEVINEEISKVKRTYGYSRIDALTVGSSANDVATALIAENENKRTMPNVGDVLVDWGGVTRVPVVKQTVQTGGEKPIYSFSFRTADNTATKTVKIQGYLYEPQTVVSVETVKDVTQQQISTLDTQLAEEVTDRTNAVNAEATAREQADTALQTNIDALKATATADANGLLSKEDKATLDALPTQLTAEQTAREQADTAINGEIQGIKDKGSLFDLFKAASATLNADGKTWTMNEVTDLTTKDMINIILNPVCLHTPSNCSTVMVNKAIRTNMLIGQSLWSNVSMFKIFASCKSLETVRLAQDLTTVNYITDLNQAFTSCVKLRKVLNPLNVVLTKSFDRPFYNCFELQEVLIYHLKANIEISNSPKLNKESILYMVQNATPDSAITITLHPTAYAMATADPEIQAELEKQPNISLAEGEPTA